MSYPAAPLTRAETLAYMRAWWRARKRGQDRKQARATALNGVYKQRAKVRKETG